MYAVLCGGAATTQEWVASWETASCLSLSYPLLLFLFCAKAWGPMLFLSLSPALNPIPILSCLRFPAWFRPALPCPALPLLCFASGKVLSASLVHLHAITASLARVSTGVHTLVCSWPDPMGKPPDSHCAFKFCNVVHAILSAVFHCISLGTSDPRYTLRRMH